MIGTILYATDLVVFVVLALCVGYMLFFSIASLFYKTPKFPAPKKLGKIAVLFPAYKEDRVIVNSVTEFLKQDYPTDRYDVFVISDQMKEETVSRLEQLPITVIKVTFQQSSKAKAMAFATDQIKSRGYDIVAIMDADNTTEPNFLSRVNEAIESGIGAVQAYRTGKESSSDVAKLDGVSENINNGMFRSGHNAVGLSAGLSGSGMAFKAEWFFENIYKLNTAGEDKEMEALLLRQRIHTVFLKDVHVFDEKVAKVDAIGNQRKRWIAAQYAILRRTIVDFPSALLHGNIDYCDKIVQWMLPPRLIQLFLLGLFTLIALITLEPALFVKWIVLCVLQVAAMLLPLPRKIFSMNLLKAIVIKIPTLIFVTIKGLFKLKGAHKNFIHTEHGDESK
jgi:cellulose synthase/poly-beta-1,6-N-acetylglucosamine synthase-like glycosyltransferase